MTCYDFGFSLLFWQFTGVLRIIQDAVLLLCWSVLLLCETSPDAHYCCVHRLLLWRTERNRKRLLTHRWSRGSPFQDLVLCWSTGEFSAQITASVPKDCCHSVASESGNLVSHLGVAFQLFCTIIFASTVTGDRSPKGSYSFAACETIFRFVIFSSAIGWIVLYLNTFAYGHQFIPSTELSISSLLSNETTWVSVSPFHSH